MAGAEPYKFCPECKRREDADGPELCPEDGALLLLVLGDDDGLCGRVFHDQYELRQVIGRGGFGTVYYAVQRSLNRPVAIKVLHREHAQNQEIVQRFFIEARAVSQLRSEHTIKILDFGQSSDGLLFMVLEYCAGSPLSHVLQGREDGTLPVGLACHVGMQLCEALGEAHSRGVVHRDIKPDNLMLEHRPHLPWFVQVLDFGLAKLTDRPDDGATVGGVVPGTPSYMSPEQCAQEPITPSSDLYAVGVLMFRMLAGVVPFDGDTALSIVMKHLREPPPQLRSIRADLPEDLTELVMGLLTKPPERRPGTAQSVAASLRKWADPYAVSPGELPPPGMQEATTISFTPSSLVGVLQLPRGERTPSVAVVAPTPIAGPGWGALFGVLLLGVALGVGGWRFFSPGAEHAPTSEQVPAHAARPAAAARVEAAARPREVEQPVRQEPMVAVPETPTPVERPRRPADIQTASRRAAETVVDTSQWRVRLRVTGTAHAAVTMGGRKLGRIRFPF